MKYDTIHIILPAIMLGMACAAASCTSDPEPEVVEYGEEMVFEVQEAASRSSVTTNSNIKEKPFVLYGDVKRTGEHNPGLNVIFNEEKVSFSDGIWSYKTPLYWLMSQEHSFVAVHPFLNGVLGISALKYENSELSFKFTVPTKNGITDYDLMEDILFATHRRIYNLDNSENVKLNFMHMLSQINIAPALKEKLMYPDEQDKNKYPDNKDEYIQIKKIELHNLKTSASFSFKPAALGDRENHTNDNSFYYKVDDTLTPVAIMSFEGVKQVTNDSTNVNICKDDDTLLVLQQDIDEDAEVVLYYTVNSDHTEYDLIRKITLPLKVGGINEWERGKVYTYEFTIEKAYTGQIKPGSIKWKVNDITIPEDQDNTSWISDGGKISQVFDPEPDSSTDSGN